MPKTVIGPKAVIGGSNRVSDAGHDVLHDGRGRRKDEPENSAGQPSPRAREDAWPEVSPADGVLDPSLNESSRH